MYRPEYERIKQETLDAKNKKKDDDEAGELTGGALSKDSLIEFDDGIYKDSSDSEEGDDPLEDQMPKRQGKRKIKTIPEEDEEGKEPI